MRYGIFRAVCYGSWPSGLWYVVLSVGTNMSEEHAMPEMLATANKTIKCHFPDEHKLRNG